MKKAKWLVTEKPDGPPDPLNPELQWQQAKWLLRQGVPPAAILRPTPIMAVRGERARDGRFDHNQDGPLWMAFIEENDMVYWNPANNKVATDVGRVFALSEDLIDNPATTAFDRYLNIYTDPLQWLQNGRRGIVVVNWPMAFDRLRYVTRIAVAEILLPTYRYHMRPRNMPTLAVIPMTEPAA